MDDPDTAGATVPDSPESDPHTSAPDPDVTEAATSSPNADSTAADSEAPAPGTALPDPIPHAGLRYSLLRLLMLLAVGGILYVIGMRGWLLAFAAVLLSGVASLFLFMKQRNDAAVNLEHTVDHWKHRRDPQDAGLAPE
jgi:hypothetical protein